MGQGILGEGSAQAEAQRPEFGPIQGPVKGPTVCKEASGWSRPPEGQPPRHQQDPKAKQDPGSQLGSSPFFRGPGHGTAEDGPSPI